MEEKEFAMSMYLNKEELYKAKSEYYEELYKKTLTTDKDAGAKLPCSDGLSAKDIKPPYAIISEIKLLPVTDQLTFHNELVLLLSKYLDEYKFEWDFEESR